ncbi:PaaI family thioesterase [Pseudomonas fluorescens]|uniref:Thioesterase domain-containing protein n=1 Tax=Pseudomonas fluorescens TaxID=294 RepID=A0A5E7DGG3_PSEFL|nr:PaaI family thioesterase [Pseudomonas fluorescens]VVO15331.1 hypothetical protein PS691_03749 [Pseudomonas fluorescens]
MNRDALFWKVVTGKLPLPNAAILLGWKFVDYDEEQCEAHIEFDAAVSLTNPMGNIQGGMLSAMLDDCMGPAIYANLPVNQIAVTIESKTSFVSPASPGRIIGWGRVDHAKGAICFTSGRLINEAGEVLATATATYRICNLR